MTYKQLQRLIFITGVWTVCNIAPTFIQNIKDSAAPIGVLESIGYSAWCVGFVVEWVADHQKTVFKAEPYNKVRLLLHIGIKLNMVSI